MQLVQVVISGMFNRDDDSVDSLQWYWHVTSLI
jgi:heme/copper-type cytochrome/quinol oxidase subunit 3